MIRLSVGVVPVVLCLISTGCSSIEAIREHAAIEMGFKAEGKGVKNSHEISRTLIYELQKDDVDVYSDSVRNLIYQMTWKQACTLYQTSTNTVLREVLIYFILDPHGGQHPFYYGVWTREDVIKLLGMPDGISFDSGSGIYTREEVVKRYGEQGSIEEGELIYTGVGFVGDGVLGYFLRFDDAGHFAGMTVAP